MCMKPKFFLLTLSLASLFLTNCAIYKIDVQQGNALTQEMVDQLELNMSARKVRFLLGTPLLVDVFHPKRWDYLYSFQKGAGNREQLHVALFFDEQDRLVNIQGDVKISPRTKQKLSPPVEEEFEPPL